MMFQAINYLVFTGLNVQANSNLFDNFNKIGDSKPYWKVIQLSLNCYTNVMNLYLADTFSYEFKTAVDHDKVIPHSISLYRKNYITNLVLTVPILIWTSAFAPPVLTTTLPKQITSLECCGKNIYIGTDECVIVAFLVEESLPQNGRATYVFRKHGEKQLPYKKPVSQLKAASALNRVVLLCDGVVSMLSMVDLEIVSSSAKIKGVGYFCLNENPIKSNPFAVEICVLSKKKGLQLYTVTEDKITLTRDISTQEAPLTMSIDGAYVCVALPTQYKIIEFETGGVQELFPYDYDSVTPTITRITREEFLLSAPGCLGVFANTTGISQRPPLQWNDNLFSVVYSHPYIVSLNDEFITVHSILDQQQKQSIPFQGGLYLGEFDGKIFVSTGRDIYALMAVPLPLQIQALLDDRRVKEALELAKNAREIGYKKEQFQKMFRRIQLQAGFVEFTEMHFEEARDLFRAGHLDICELLVLFSGLLPSNSSYMKSVPPLHEIPDITTLTRSQPDNVLYYKQFLISYLEEVRGTRDTQGVELELDTALLKLYAESSSPNLQTLVTCDNAISIKDSESTLERHGQYHSLGLLYRKHTMYDKALIIWTNIVEGKCEDRAFPGLGFIVDVLCSLHDLDLVWKYVDWVLERDQSLGVKIFIDRPSDEPPSDKLLPEVVVDFLSKYPTAVISYLEYLVYTKKLKSEKFHTHLAALYLEQVLRLQGDRTTAKQELDLARSKLREMLQHSDLYRVQLILGKVKGTDLHPEMAILHGKLGEHDKALSILVHKLRDFTGAENYCIRNARDQDPEHRKQLYESLLEIYMDSKQETRGLYITQALSLLNNNQAEFDFIKVMKMLPDHWSVGLISNFLVSAVRKHTHGSRLLHLERMLRRAENLQVKTEKIQTTRSAVSMGEDSKCSVCRQPFQEASFVRYPNGVVTHTKCASNKYVCPITGKLFGTTQPSKSSEGSSQDGDSKTVTMETRTPLSSKR